MQQVVYVEDLSLIVIAIGRRPKPQPARTRCGHINSSYLKGRRCTKITTSIPSVVSMFLIQQSKWAYTPETKSGLLLNSACKKVTSTHWRSSLRLFRRCRLCFFFRCGREAQPRSGSAFHILHSVNLYTSVRTFFL